MFAVGLAVAGCQGIPDAPQPDGQVIPTADSHERALLNFASCMRDRGWNATVSDGGVTVGNVPADQRTIQQSDGQVCSEEWLTLDVNTFTDSEWKAAYAAALDTANCLERLGFSTAPPSLQVFIEGEAGWNPYTDLVESGVIRPMEIRTHEEACPQPGYWPDRG